MEKNDKQEERFSFEEAYVRLETILNELNGGETPLEKSLELYEEADSLIALCSTKLNRAEHKIQTLIKNRSGELALNEEGKPELKSLTSTTEKVLGSELHT
ncbi:MAG: Exodeoxyribonuclease 7 small subunit [Chlamydiae bacterium]|nr:Exodeoxyribonuclease 7 small subunit [Chlamydiota bacterium]